MRSLTRILIDIIVITAIVGVALLVYYNFKDPIFEYFFTEREELVFIGDLALKVRVADEQGERLRGLGGVTELGELEGMLFIFDRSDNYGIWMKDMKIPIDIIWINEELEVVHIAENVSPGTYPKVFRPNEPARFVLEMNAYFADTYDVKEGQYINMPASFLPDDVRENLRE